MDRRRGYQQRLSFDTIPHDALIKCLERRIADRSVLKLIRMWLECPIVETDERGRTKVTRSTQGTPQGVISPLLANLYLHWFEKRFYSSDGPGRWANAKLVRYADDFVVLGAINLVNWSAGSRDCSKDGFGSPSTVRKRRSSSFMNRAKA